MKAKELAKELLKNPDFEVQFQFSEIINDTYNFRSFFEIEIDDIGYSDKIIKLGGEE